MARGATSTKTKTATCAFCAGKGKDPFGIPSKLSACQVCIGRGTVRVASASEACPSCMGTGRFAAHRLSCSVCKGRGVVSIVHGHRRRETEGQGAQEGLQPGTGLPPISAYTFTAVDQGILRRRRARGV